MTKVKNEGGYDFGNFKKDSLTKPRDLCWENWMKFEKIGDKVAGYIRDVFYRPAEGQFKEQRGITIEQQDGELINVGIKRLSFILNKTDGLRLGDPVTIVLEAELPPKQKGFSKTKVFAYYGTNLPENAGNKTVRELENEDIALGGTIVKTADDEDDDSDPLADEPGGGGKKKGGAF